MLIPGSPKCHCGPPVYGISQFMGLPYGNYPSDWNNSAWHIIGVDTKPMTFLSLIWMNLLFFFSSQDLDVALPIIETYKDQLLAIGEVNIHQLIKWFLIQTSMWYMKAVPNSVSVIRTDLDNYVHPAQLNNNLSVLPQ